MSSKENENKPGSLNRRDLLKVISLAPAAAMAPGFAAHTLAAPLPQAAAEPAGSYNPKVFDAQQWKTVRVLCDLIIPADDHSGSASEAGVPEIMDDLLNLKGEKSQTEMSGGLAWLDWKCNHTYGHDFVDCTDAQQKEMLDRIAYPEKAKPEDATGVAFFISLRSLVMGGFYTSKIGIQDLQYMGNQMLSSWNGCPENVTSRLGVDYSNWERGES